MPCACPPASPATGPEAQQRSPICVLRDLRERAGVLFRAFEADVAAAESAIVAGDADAFRAHVAAAGIHAVKASRVLADVPRGRP